MRHRFVAILCLFVTLAGCSTATSGNGRFSLGAAPDADVDIKHTDHGAIDRIAGNAIADIEEFWKQEYPKIADGASYRDLKGGVWSVDPDDPPDKLPCELTEERITGNAFYCPKDDLIIWDRTGLLAGLNENYGPYSVAMVLAHEWGHAIQFRHGDPSDRTIDKESQADCFAGAFTAYAFDGNAPHFPMTADDRDNALAGFLLFADPVGVATPNTPGAHGSGFDRVSAFQEGYAGGAKICVSGSFGPDRPYTEIEFLDEGDAATMGTLDLSETLEKGNNDLNGFWQETLPRYKEEWEPLNDVTTFDADDPPTCDGEEVSQIASYCSGDDAIYLEGDPGLDLLFRKTGQPDESTGEQAGDYAVLTMEAMAYGLAVRERLGKSLDDRDALLGAVCMAGLYTQDLFNNTLRQHNGLSPSRGTAILISAGDLDEAIQALLIGITASTFDGTEDTTGFERINVFREAVTQGFGPCNKY